MTRRSRPIENPTLAEAFTELRSDYQASKVSRYRRRRSGLSSSGSSADYHYRSESDYLRMMEYSRDYFRNDVVVSQGVRRLVDNVVQGGIPPNPRTGDPGADRELTARWTQWGNDPEQCDLAGELTWYMIQRLVLQSVVVDGDILILGQTEGTIQSVEAHRCRTPRATKRNVVHGILLDGNRRRLEYWLTKDDIDPMRTVTKVSEMRRYPARDEEGQRQVFHVYRPDRVSQTRGITAFAPIADVVSMHDDLQFAKLVQAQVASCFAIIRNRELEFHNPSGEQRGEQETETLDDGSTRTIEGIAPGMEVRSAPGEKLEGFSPRIPNPEFFPHATLLLTFVAINLGLPVAVLLLDPSETNFSGWRGAIDQARLGFRQLQIWLTAMLHRPVYQFKVMQWAIEDSGLRKLGPKVFRNEWRYPSWAYIEPMKDASADLLRRRNAQISGRRWAAERGFDYDELVGEIVEDNASLIVAAHEKAEELNKTYLGLGVTWREVASLPTPDGVKVQIGADTSDNQGDGKDAQGRKRQ